MKKQYLRAFAICLAMSSCGRMNEHSTSIHMESEQTRYPSAADAEMVDVKDYGGAKDIGSMTWIDVINHTDPNDQYNPRSRGMAFEFYSVSVHETCHMLNAQVRSRFYKDDVIDVGYSQKGKAVVFKSEGPKLSELRNYVPATLKKNYDYGTYLEQQPTNQPILDKLSYLFDEWGAYLQNARLTRELELAGKPENLKTGGRGSDNAAPFFGYVSAGIHYAVIKNHKVLKDRAFLGGVAVLAQETFKHMKNAKDSEDLGPDLKKYMDFYRSSKEFDDIRKSLITVYGEEWWKMLVAEEMK